MTENGEFRLTGKHVLAIFIVGFGIIFGVNFYMAARAVGTFPGLEVDSSYADSQDFDERRLAQEALGWDATVEVDVETGVLRLYLLDADGDLVAPAELEALLTRPTSRQDDQLLELTRNRGAFEADAMLEPGRWRLRLTGIARDGTAYRHNITFEIDEA